MCPLVNVNGNWLLLMTATVAYRYHAVIWTCVVTSFARKRIDENTFQNKTPCKKRHISWLIYWLQTLECNTSTVVIPSDSIWTDARDHTCPHTQILAQIDRRSRGRQLVALQLFVRPRVSQLYHHKHQIVHHANITLRKQARHDQLHSYLECGIDITRRRYWSY